MEKLTVERSIWVAAPRERVWQAITLPEQLTLWYAPGYAWEIPVLEAGATAIFDKTAFHTIEVLDPPHRFVLGWEEEGKPMVTSFILEEENDGTRVTITESGFEALPEDIRQKRFDETGKGYSMSMENLKAYLEGRSIPF